MFSKAYRNCLKDEIKYRLDKFIEASEKQLERQAKMEMDALKWRITMLEDKLKDCENRVEIVIDPKDLDNFVSNRKKHNAK
jgi:hypothetical protein